MIDISICICTRNRQDGLKKILDSLEGMRIPEQTRIKIVIVENDNEPFSENVVKSISAKKFEISYFLENRIGLAYARNRTVKEAGKCDFCCFVDDDQIVIQDWLVELLKCQKEFDADGVWGPNLPVFSKDVPAYIKQFHTPDIFEYGTVTNTAHTNCLLLRKDYLDRIEGPFDLRLNFTGGEDSYLTHLLTEMGAVIRFNPNAVAYEIIPESRTTFKFLIKRSFRISNARSFINSLTGVKKSGIRSIPMLIARLGYGMVIALPYLVFGTENKLKGVIEIINATGGFAFIFGKHSQFYK